MSERIFIYRKNGPKEQMQHFIERVQDRYGITLSEADYNKLCNPKGVFHGVFSKQRRKTIGWLIFNGVKIWVLRDGETNRLATAYPLSVGLDEKEMIRACFSGVSRAAALQIHSYYLSEEKKISKLSFKTDREAAVYFFTKTKFPALHIKKYKRGSVETYRVSHAIRGILNGESPTVRIALKIHSIPESIKRVKEKCAIKNDLQHDLLPCGE